VIAKKAEVKKLILGHYSSRYKDISLFKKEAEEIFTNVTLAETGKIISM
jgi:ribonuclease Z